MRTALAALVLAACAGRPAPAPAPAPWERIRPAGSPSALYVYPDPIQRYAPDDRGAYIVRIADRAVLESLGPTDDILGDDGYVVRLTSAQRDGLARRPGVTAVAILQPADRRSILIDRATELPEARIDLFADATAAEADAIAAWIAWRGGRVLWRGRTALRARLPREAIAEASRLSPVRWIE